MKKSLDHLPEGKRRELERVVAIIREGFAEAVAGRRAPRFKQGKLLKIILYGSYARGDWVEDPVGRYFSDYDILVVVDHEDLADVGEFWLPTEERLTAEISSGALRAPVSVIYHSLDDVNERLSLGRYFFIDIVREGIALFEEPGHPFGKPEPLAPDKALKETQAYYDQWFGSAVTRFSGAKFHVEQGNQNDAAFDLHQTAERLYHCLLIVHTLYSPKTHNLNRLRSMGEEQEPALKAVWLSQNKFQRRCYELLRGAYVNARYSPHYRITDEELAWLVERISLLQSLVREACVKRIADLKSDL